MYFNTKWDVDQHKTKFENAEHWKFRRAFLIANQNKYPEDRLETLSRMFIFIEFMECKYPKPTMDFIHNLSQSFVNDLREKLHENTQDINMTDSNTAKDYGNAQAITSNLNINQPPNQNMRYTTPYDSNCLIPGFMLKVVDGANVYDILEQSCRFSKTTKPEIVYEGLNVDHIQAKLYIHKKLIAVAAESTIKHARKSVAVIAYDILKEMCFTIKVKEIDAESTISLADMINLKEAPNSSTNSPNCSTNYKNISDNNLGNMILKNMGWKEGDGLGKNNQGIKSPIEVVQLKKRVGLGVAPSRETAKMSLNKFQTEVKEYIMKFSIGPKIKLSFTTEFTKDERKIIHKICTHLDLKTKSYGKNENRQIVIQKKQNPREIFFELITSVNFENDCYKLEQPRHESNTYT
ncbi:NF-kappa-B-repressing factor-like [Rhopalosiphum padi]|uniref:NF-kappa-B-repressing factor-like n=1 Tax=Rhopalosiphum padi TaxID=40932 RepID=UPI00298E6220|nr:NF-kappa-B-repressing factor-like [Rhopalosiphum padi]